MTSFLVVLFCFFFAVQASPLSLLIPRAADDVYTPDIISPNKGTRWVIGKEASVKWAVKNPPKDISNRASVRLSDYTEPLAVGFSLLDGQVDFVLPCDVKPGFHYVTLFGDSANNSDLFLIESSPDCPAEA